MLFYTQKGFSQSLFYKDLIGLWSLDKNDIKDITLEFMDSIHFLVIRNSENKIDRGEFKIVNHEKKMSLFSFLCQLASAY